MLVQIRTFLQQFSQHSSIILSLYVCMYYKWNPQKSKDKKFFLMVSNFNKITLRLFVLMALLLFFFSFVFTLTHALCFFFILNKVKKYNIIYDVCIYCMYGSFPMFFFYFESRCIDFFFLAKYTSYNRLTL